MLRSATLWHLIRLLRAHRRHGYCTKDLFMDSQQNVCHDLSRQLAVYRAFNNHSAMAAIIRQMAMSHCPIGASKPQ